MSITWKDLRAKIDEELLKSGLDENAIVQRIDIDPNTRLAKLIVHEFGDGIFAVWG